MFHDSINRIWDRNANRSDPVGDKEKIHSKSWEFVCQTRRENVFNCDVLSKNDSWQKTSTTVHRRKRARSCSESTDLRKLSKDLELAVIQLNKICDEGKINIRPTLGTNA